MTFAFRVLINANELLELLACDEFNPGERLLVTQDAQDNLFVEVGGQDHWAVGKLQEMRSRRGAPMWLVKEMMS